MKYGSLYKKGEYDCCRCPPHFHSFLCFLLFCSLSIAADQRPGFPFTEVLLYEKEGRHDNKFVLTLMFISMTIKLILQLDGDPGRDTEVLEFQIRMRPLLNVIHIESILRQAFDRCNRIAAAILPDDISPFGHHVVQLSVRFQDSMNLSDRSILVPDAAQDGTDNDGIE